MELWGHMVSVYLISRETYKLPKWLGHFAFLAAMYECISCFISLSIVFYIASFKILVIMEGIWWFYSVFQVMNNADFFHMFVIGISPLVKCLF